MPNQTTRRKKQTRKPIEQTEPLLMIIPRENPLTRLIFSGRPEGARDVELWDKQFGPPQPTEERGRERSETDSDRDDSKRQDIAPDSSNNSISGEEMALEPAAVQAPSNMLTDTATTQPTVATQTDDNSSTTCSPQLQLEILQQLTTVEAQLQAQLQASQAQYQASQAQLQNVQAQIQDIKAFIVTLLPASLQVGTASPPPSAPMPPVHAMHVMQAEPLGQQPELAQPQPSADTGHAASAPPPPVQPPRSPRPPKQPRWTPPQERTSYAAAAAGAAAPVAAATAAFTSQTWRRKGAPYGRRAAAAASSFASTFLVRRNFVFKAPPGSLPESVAPLKDRLLSFLGPRLPGAPLPISDAVLLGSQAASTRVFFSLDSLEAADALVGRRGALKASGVSIQDFLTPEELKIKRALWPRFLEAKAKGQRPQFHRARLVVS